MENLVYHDRCRLLNSNAVLVARHFQYWVEIFFKEIAKEIYSILFKFGKFFAKETLVAEPSPENNAIKEYVKEDILHAKNEILDKVKDYIKTILNPSK